jgi:SAM-dependent methyltransferase
MATNMKSELKKHIPSPVWNSLKTLYYKINSIKKKFIFIGYRIFGRPYIPLETTKAKPRRLRDGFFEKYCVGKGLDVGYGGDKLVPHCKGWDLEHGDAQFLIGEKKESYDFVYASHILEHIMDPALALKDWWKVVKPQGFLILFIPDRDLYEKKKTLPSRWNMDHKHFFLLENDEMPDTIGVIPLIEKELSNFKIIYAKLCSEGHSITDPKKHSDGEYSIEVVIQKV